MDKIIQLYCSTGLYWWKKLVKLWVALSLIKVDNNCDWMDYILTMHCSFLCCHNDVIIIDRFIHYTAAPNPPTDLRALLITSSNTLSIAWTQSSSEGGSTQPASYVIFYEATIGEADRRGYGVSASSSQAGIANRNSGQYMIRIVATSTQHPSLPAEVTTTNGESQMTRCNIYIYHE